MPALIRVGHRGAPALAPENTLEGFDAALALGVDMIEFDILPGRRRPGQLFVAHDYAALTRRPALTLETALAHLASERFANVRLQLDIKRRGHEAAVLEALGEGDLRGRAFVSTGIRGVLPAFRALAPELPLGWTVPDLPLVSHTPVLAARYRSSIPRRAAQRIREGAIDALVPHWSLVTETLVQAVRAAGGEIYAWTVNDDRLLARMAALGVTGVITNDPRLFG
jgi:glycerophosphoryl diester phosphodiesterase